MPPPPKVNVKSARIGTEVLGFWDEGKPVAEIARLLSCGTNTVRRILDQQRPGERLSRNSAFLVRESEWKEEKTCTGCEQVLPLDQFPPRPDREGAVFSQCIRCRPAWYSAWQRANPERNREGVRRRRARLRAARTEPYRDLDIHVRDEGLCWFCALPVDPLLRYPDLMSMVVHHLHPVAKRGPDIPKNVAIAHYDCNHRAKDKYDSPFAAWSVIPVSSAIAREQITRHHYLHAPGLVSFAYGLCDASGVINGVVTFGSTSSMRILQSVTQDRQVRVLGLNRLWIADEAPFGAGSWFLARALRQLPPCLVISYADTAVTDPRYGTSHSGGIYRACSFSFAGLSRSAIEWRLPGSSRNVGRKAPGSIAVPVSVKARYWMATGSSAERRALRRQCLWPVLPYEAGASLRSMDT